MFSQEWEVMSVIELNRPSPRLHVMLFSFIPTKTQRPAQTGGLHTSALLPCLPATLSQLLTRTERDRSFTFVFLLKVNKPDLGGALRFQLQLVSERLLNKAGLAGDGQAHLC